MDVNDLALTPADEERQSRIYNAFNPLDAATAEQRSSALVDG